MDKDMFLEFFNLKEQPFGVTPDPRFLYLGSGHREALASLYYGIESDRAFVALIARPGLGKTTLTFQLLEHLQETSRTVFLFQTQCNAKEFFQYLLNGLSIDTEGMELVSMHNKLNEILAREMLAGRRFVLAIDEAQNLAPEVLETIRLLSNFETPSDKLIQILLIGQPQLADKLAQPELEQLHQRISVFAKLEPLNPDDIARYISHRLEVAGYEGSPLFSPGALRIITEQSQGIPRKINALCFSALSLACAMGRKMVDVTMMEEVVSDRDIEPVKRPKVVQPVAVSTTSPMLQTTLSPYHEEKAESGAGRWTLSIGGIALCLLLGFAILQMSPGSGSWLMPSFSQAGAFIRNGAASVGNLAGSKSDSGPVSSSLDVQAAELPKVNPGNPATPNNEIETYSVFTQPGETLSQVTLRSLGVNDAETIEQIRKLNPAIADFDHLEAGQRIRLPRMFVTGTPANEGSSAAGKN
jgi:type II secretory pathway predicted ATPase ExeA